MENMRMKMGGDEYFDPKPLGGRSRPARGVISQDLGCTEYKTSSGSRKVTKSTKKALPPKDDGYDETSDDDLDILSSKHLSSPPLLPVHKKSKAPRKGQSSTTEARRAASGSRPRPKPRPNHRGVEPVDTDDENKTTPFTPKTPRHLDPVVPKIPMPPSNQLALGLQRSRKLSDSHGTSPLEELNPNKAKRYKAPYDKREPEPFPMQDEYQAAKSKKRSPKRARAEPAPFPMGTPSSKRLSSKPPAPAPFPMSSPSPSQQKRINSKTKTAHRAPQRFPLDDPSTNSFISVLDDEHDMDELALTDNDNATILMHGGPRPFPMSMSQFPPKAKNDASGSKRSAHEGDDQRANKRSRPSPEPESFNNFSSLSLDGDSNVDPSTICPYCDEPWPPAPSPMLLSLLERTKRRSYADPRPGNALGLTAPLAAFVELCQRHRFEMTHLPLALERGWPTRLDFASLPKRIRGYKKELGRFIEKPYQSQFWREVRDDVKEVGRTKVVSVSGQYATFERTQPGYYGEQGSIIIHQSLYSLFPPDGIPVAAVDPLTPDQFLTRVLVPETAVLLIQEDMGLPTKEEALSVLDESKKYGLAMFPEQAQGDEVAEVGERLARERAMRRRKVLEERGEADADVKRQVDQERRDARKTKGKSRDARKTKGKSRDQSDVKRKGKAKDSDTDREHYNDEEQEAKKSTREAKAFFEATHSSDQTPKARYKRWNADGDILMVDSSDQQTPRPAMVMASTRESSITSWRSKRSPSTSPDTHPVKTASRSSSLHKLSRKLLSSPPKPPTQESRKGSQWTFDLQDPSSSSDREDVDIDEMIARHEAKAKLTESTSSDSDVVVIENDPTPKSKSKSKSCRIIKKTIVSEESDSDHALDSDAVIAKVTHKPKPKPKPKPSAESADDVETDGVHVSRVLGQTKRRKKGRAKDMGARSGAEDNYGWLLDDSSE